MTMTVTNDPTIDRPPIAAAEITADLILETAERLGIKLVHTTYFDDNFRCFDGNFRTCGCAIGVAAIAVRPELAKRGFFGSDTIAEVFPNFWCKPDGSYSFENGIEAGFMRCEADSKDPDYLRGYAVGCEVARRAGLED
jgi:hypothetical protein